LLSCAAIALLACSAGGLQAREIYKYVDANGIVVYSDHADPVSAPANVVEWQDPRYPPHEMHVCWANCFTLIYDGRLFHRTDGTDETWTVTKFTADSLVLHRHSTPAKWNGFSDDVTYAGHVVNDRLVGVTLDGKPTSGIDASWGIALHTLPGNNTERDARVARGTPDPTQGGSGTDQPSFDAGQDFSVSAAAAPPPLPEDPQPVVPEEGYLWTPGYWYWGGAAYVWVPGAWLQPPAVGLLWTPAYWSFAEGRYLFHPGYWGPHVGFYGGIDYGFGYFGSGYAGGHWVGHAFAYNSIVNHLNPSVVRNVYAAAVAGPGRNLVSFNGGPGGTTAVATEQERHAAAEARPPAAGARSVVRVVAAPPVGRAAPPPVHAASPVQHFNAGAPKPVIVREAAHVTRTPVEAESEDRPSRSSEPRSNSVPAPRVGHASAPKAPHRP
jgi:hypothetical protein